MKKEILFYKKIFWPRDYIRNIKKGYICIYNYPVSSFWNSTLDKVCNACESFSNRMLLLDSEWHGVQIFLCRNHKVWENIKANTFIKQCDKWHVMKIITKTSFYYTWWRHRGGSI